MSDDYISQYTRLTQDLIEQKPTATISDDGQTGDDESEEFDPEISLPFQLMMIYGYDKNLGIRLLNRNPDEHFCIYSLGHVASMINLKTKRTHHLLGHENTVIAMEHDKKGLYLATADKSTLMIWDIGALGEDQPIRLRFMYKPFGRDAKIANAGLSSCGKYLAIGSEKTETGSYIQFWRWSFAQDDYDGNLTVLLVKANSVEFEANTHCIKESYSTEIRLYKKFHYSLPAIFQISEKFGKIQSIRFSSNPGEDEFFAVTLTYGVIFAWWDRQNGTLETHTPTEKKIDIIRQSCYVPGQRTVASVTSDGRIIIWSDIIVNLTNLAVTNRKNLVKIVPAQNSCSINDVKSVDGMLVTCDELGEIRFYDTEIRLVFVCSFWTLPAIDCIIPIMASKEYKLIEADNFDVEETAGVELVYRSTCPTDFTMKQNPFIVREFYITTRVGEILYCNVLKKTTESILFRADDMIASFDYIKQKPWIVSANSDGRIYFFDYGQLTVIRDHRLKRYKLEDAMGQEVQPVVTCIRISNDGNHLGVGYINGALWMVDPLTIIPVTNSPMHHSYAPIREIVFTDRRFCAYADDNSTVILLHYDNDMVEWSLIGKYRFHHKPLILLAVVENLPNKYHLLSLGQDRLFAEYDLDKSLRKLSLEIKRDKLLEQYGVFTAAKVFKMSKIVSKDTSTNGMVILVADDQYKFKIFDIVTMDRLYTFVSPIFDSPIREFVSFSEPHVFCNNFLIFGTEKTLGCIMLPIDGNTFRYTGITAHPKMISMLVPWGPGLFALGKGEVGGIIWNIDQENVLKYYQSGGKGLEPFCKFLPGGKEGWMFKEMQDMFYYMQIMTRGSDAPEEHTVNDFIPINDLADYMRSIGFFPSDYDIDCMYKEATRTTSPSIPPPTEISFQDIVKMYLNHKPVSGYHLDDIAATIEYLADQHSSDFVNERQDEVDHAQISLERILEILTTKGEIVTKDLAKRYLIELLSEEAGKLKLSKLDVAGEFRNLPDNFSVKQFCAELLGIDVKETTDGNLVATLGEALNPAEIDTQLENKINIVMPDSELTLDKDIYSPDEGRSLLRQGRVIKVIKNNK